MPYITHTELAERPGALELAQVASTGHYAVVPAELLEAALRGGDRTAWTPEQNAQADEALRRIDDAIRDADALIDGFLVQRGYTVPLALPSHSGRNMLTTWGRAITRYLLQKNSINDEAKSPIARDYRDALKLLQQLAEGKFSLGANDPAKTGAAAASTDVRFTFDANVFGRDQLKSFR